MFVGGAVTAEGTIRRRRRGSVTISRETEASRDLFLAQRLAR
jgi:hypothetical protein